MLTFIGMMALLPPVHAQTLKQSLAPGLAQIESLAGAPVTFAAGNQGETVSFMRTLPGARIPVGLSATAPANERALQFLSQHGPVFGLGQMKEIRLKRASGKDETGMEHVRFQQLYAGLPIAGAEVSVHLKGSSVAAVNANLLGDTGKIDTRPTIKAEQALATAQALIQKHYPDEENVTFSDPELQILNRSVLEGGRFPSHLAWYIESDSMHQNEQIWVDAHEGNILLHFNQQPHAKSRDVHDAMDGSTLPGTLVRSEGDPATGDADADNAYEYSGDVYDYFFTEHGRDSYDGAGAPIVSTVHYCPSGGSCPYANAFWNGTQMVYGEGFSAADDVVAHELTHAVTENSADLFYYMQSGALNESFSDIFGETVDQLNGSGTDDAASKWLMGEDVPGFGAIRDMADPTNFGDPGKLSDSAEFVCDDPGTDGGGVHSNSGVPNHAYQLMVDGGTYNSFSISGIGLTKAGKIQYRALTNYLLSASDFLDNYNALIQSCNDLIGTAGISAADCTEVQKALDAVEMADTWPCNSAQDAVAAACPNGGTPDYLYYEDFESGFAGFGTTANPTNVWFAGNFFATSGTGHLYGADIASTTDSSVFMVSAVSIPAGGAILDFDHSFGFENFFSNFYDGGVLEYSTDGGTNWSDAGSMIVDGADYGGSIHTCCSNPLAGSMGFVGDSHGYTTTRLDLGSLSGSDVQFRFRIGTDYSIDDYGWFIDDIRIYNPPALLAVDLTGITDSTTLTRKAKSFNGDNYQVTDTGHVTLQYVDLVSFGPGTVVADGGSLLIQTDPMLCH